MTKWLMTSHVSHIGHMISFANTDKNWKENRKANIFVFYYKGRLKTIVCKVGVFIYFAFQITSYTKWFFNSNYMYILYTDKNWNNIAK